jgi:hypothetical protein
MAIGICHHHPLQPAKAQCVQCGKGICKDCLDSFNAGMSTGNTLCFSCSEEVAMGHKAAFAVSVNHDKKNE